jgi:glutathione S-transferase
MGLQLYDLAGAQAERRFSPYCWRAKFALAHKGLAFDTIPWRFTDKDAIAFSGQGRVPVLVDGDRIVFDSWTIATYLEDAYPDRSSLFRGDGGRVATRFINTWTDTVVNGGIARLIITDIFAVLDEKDRSYFRQTREKRFGATLEAVIADRDMRVAEFRQSLAPPARRSWRSALSRWRDASLRRLRRLWLLSMGTLRKPISVADAG